MVTAIAVIKIGRYIAGYDPFLADCAIKAAKFTGMRQNVAHIPLVNGQDEAYLPTIRRKQCDLNRIKQSESVYGSSSLGE